MGGVPVALRVFENQLVGIRSPLEGDCAARGKTAQRKCKRVTSLVFKAARSCREKSIDPPCVRPPAQDGQNGEEGVTNGECGQHGVSTRENLADLLLDGERGIA